MLFKKDYVIFVLYIFIFILQIYMYDILIIIIYYNILDIVFGLVLYRVSCQCLCLLGHLLWKNKESVFKRQQKTV